MSSNGNGDKTFRARFYKIWSRFIAEWDPFDGIDPTAHHGIIEYLGEFGVSRALILTTFFVGFLTILSMQIPNLPVFIFGWLAGTAPVWLPCALFWGMWKAYGNYARAHFLELDHIKPVVLEVRIPREITKSPRAMEFVFTNLFVSSGEVTFVHRAYHGGVRPWYSFELASFGGEIHFYVWCWGNYRRIVESSIYAQYPEVEIVEVEDYMSKFHYDPKIHTCRVGDYIYKGSAGGDEVPIKTYVDFELDKDPKEEFLIDPFATVLEVMSNLKPTEQCWIQMNFRLETKNGIFVRKDHGWKKRVEAAVDQIRKEMIYKDPDQDPEAKGFPRPTWKQNELMRAIERQLAKTPFEVGMRFAYISEAELHGPTFTAIRWIFKLYNWPGFGQIMRSGRGHDPFDYPWQDYEGYRWALTTRRHLDAMRRRSYFYQPWTTPGLVMTPELMASLYHYPSGSIKTPGLTRIQATKSEPPSNLPR